MDLPAFPLSLFSFISCLHATPLCSALADEHAARTAALAETTYLSIELRIFDLKSSELPEVVRRGFTVSFLRR